VRLEQRRHVDRAIIFSGPGRRRWGGGVGPAVRLAILVRAGCEVGDGALSPLSAIAAWSSASGWPKLLSDG
jgi:hypothetical protein